MSWSLTDVRFRHPGAARDAINNVTLATHAGCITALLGPNGAGKSTLLQLMLGVLPVSSGDIRFGNRPIAAWTRTALAREVGVVPQGEAEPLFTVREMVAMGRYPFLGRWQRERESDATAIAAAMRRCSVDEFADRRLATLSGGERQRVRLARALAQEPSVLVLDEPTTSLDIRHEMIAFELLRSLRDDGVTVVLVTHNLNLAARYADDLVLLHRGEVVARGQPTSVITTETISRVYDWPVAVELNADGAPQVVPQAFVGAST